MEKKGRNELLLNDETIRKVGMLDRNPGGLLVRGFNYGDVCVGNL